MLTWSGSGNPGVDTMMLAAKAEKAGIKSTVVNSEMSKYAGDTGYHLLPPRSRRRGLCRQLRGRNRPASDGNGLGRLDAGQSGDRRQRPDVAPPALPPRLHQRHRRQPPLQRFLLNNTCDISPHPTPSIMAHPIQAVCSISWVVPRSVPNVLNM